MAHLRRSPAALSVLATAVAAAGCGSGASTSVTRHSMTSVRSCLDDRGIEVRGGATPDPSQDRNAPDVGELVTRGAFVAFYSTKGKADARAAEVRANVARAGGKTERYGDVTVGYFTGSARDEVIPCLSR
jgi:hypothetical protein